MIIVVLSFSKSFVLKCFPSTSKLKAGGLKSVFEKLRFGDGLVWTVGLTVKIKLRFQMSPV